jgi:hypothetical protein
VVWRLSAERHGFPRQALFRSLGKGGAATGAPIWQRLGAVFIVAVQPVHNGLRTPAGAFCNLSGAGALCDIVQGQHSLAGAGMGGIQGHVPQVSQGLAPATMINA